MIRILFSLLWFCACHSYSVDLAAGTNFCTSIDAKVGSQLTGSFEVIVDGPKFVAVTLNGPPPSKVLHFESRYDKRQPDVPEEVFSEGSFAIDIELSGEYMMCLENNDASQMKTVAYNLRIDDAKKRKYIGLEAELHELHEGLELLRDHQSYMNQRERVHQEALEIINQKVVFWTIFETVVVVGVAYWQLRYISTFFETKRRM